MPSFLGKVPRMRRSPAIGPAVATVLILVLDLACESIASRAAAAEFPACWSAAQVDSLAQAHRGQSALTLVSHRTLGLEFDPEEGCLRADLRVHHEDLVLDARALAAVAVVAIEQGPQLEVEDFQARILSAGGRLLRVLARNELDWATFTTDGDRVITLDGEVSVAAVPGLRAGERLQSSTRYRLTSHHGLPVAVFGGTSLAMADCRYDITVPKEYRLLWSAQGEAQLVDRLQAWSDTTGSRVNWHWRLTGLPAAPAEATGRCDDPGQVTLAVHLAATGRELPERTFAAGADWRDIARGCRESLEPAFAVTPEVAALAGRLVSGSLSDRERIDVIYAHVQSHTRYLAIYRGLGGIIPESAGKVLADGYGDCKGLGALLIALLRAAGLEAWPVLVRTGPRGPLSIGVPNATQFDHFVVWVSDGGEGVWLDATLEGCPTGYIHPDDAASPVLMLRPGAEGLAEIPYAAWGVGEDRYDVSGTLDAGGLLTLDVALEATGINAVLLRGQCLHLTPAELALRRRQRLLPNSIPLSPAADAASTDELPDRVRWSLTATGNRPLPAGSGVRFLPLVLPALPRLSAALEASQLTDRNESWEIRLPEGWTVAADTVGIATPLVTWNRRLWQEGGYLRLERTVRWDRLAARGRGPSDRKDLWDRTLRQVCESEQGFIAVRVGPGGAVNRAGEAGR
jgi:transglutaminase-like putative cysteine protease